MGNSRDLDANTRPAPRIRAAGPMMVTQGRLPAIQTTQVTVLFADLRGYTAIAEQLPPARLVPLLDEFLKVLASATALFGGEVFHMAGDGIMAAFGLRDCDSAGAADALAAGRAILQNFAPVAQRWRTELHIESGIGVGLHLGEVALGAIGPPRLRTTTIVGDTVNVAARLCSRARAGELLFSCTVAEALGERTRPAMPYLQLPQLELRGRSAAIDIWCVPAAERISL